MRTMTKVERPARLRSRAGLWSSTSVAVRVGCIWAHETTAGHRRPRQTNTHSPPPRISPGLRHSPSPRMLRVYLTITSTSRRDGPTRPTSATCCTSTPSARRVVEVTRRAGARVLPRGIGGALHGRAAARGRPGRAGARARAPRRRRVAARAVRQRPPVRRVVDAGGRAGQGVPHRARRPLRRPARAGRRTRWTSRSTSRPCRATATPTWCGGCSSPWAGPWPPTPVALDETVPRGATRATSTSADRRARCSAARCPTSTCCCRCSTARKHYWVSADEVDKLVRAGGDWLAAHPERELITAPCLAQPARLVDDAVARLAELDDLPRPRRPRTSDAEADVEADARPLVALRREAVVRRPARRGRPARGRPRLRRGCAAPRPARRPGVHRGPGRRRLGARPGARRAPAAPGDRCPTASATGSRCSSRR